MRLTLGEHRRIFVYGDSFAGNYGPLMTWPKLVREKIGIPMTNRAVQGSSTEYAMLQFHKDIPKIGVDDIVIFIMSNVGRLHFKRHATDPSSASGLAQHLGGVVNLDTWNLKNKEYLEWYLKNVDHDLINVNHACYINTLKEYARSETRRTILLFVNPTVTAEFPVTRAPENLLMPRIIPTGISQNEFIVKDHWPYILTTCHKDVRVNHLSQPNLDLLSTAVVESIKTRSTVAIDTAPYLTGIFKRIENLNDYKKYETAGYLVPYQNWQQSQLGLV
jgi:hypothetical protein